MRLPSAASIERLPRIVRALLGCAAACLAVSLTYNIVPLRGFPLQLAFPTVILAAWFFGMSGGVACALTDAALVDHYLTKTELHFSGHNVAQELRLSVFLIISILLGWAIRRLAQQRAAMATKELRQGLALANARRELAEERAHSSEVLRDRDEVLQIALGANGMGLWLLDVQNGSLYWSDEKFRMIGCEPGTIEPSIDLWMEHVHPADVGALRVSTAETMKNGNEYRHQYRVIWPDGSIHWVESQGKCQRGTDGSVSRVVGVVADITGRKFAEDAMLRTEKLAVAGRLAASIAHEINNPLEAVANLLYLVTHADSLDAARTDATQALEELMRVSLIAQQTLKFNRQSGAPKLTQLSEIIQSVLALFRGKLIAAQIEVEVRVEEESPVKCMPGEVQQIFANLISNAIESFSPNSHGRIVVRLRPSLDWRDYATPGMRVTVCDSGAGMDRATMRRILEPFFTTKTDTGTGLGMWVVAQLIERHRGHLRVLSRQITGGSRQTNGGSRETDSGSGEGEQGGTAFSIFLPTDGIAGTVMEELSEPAMLGNS